MAIKTEDNQSPLTIDEMWRAWPDAKSKSPNDAESEDALNKRLQQLSMEVPTIIPAKGDRITFSPTSPRSIAAQQALRKTKLAIYEDILSFYHQEKNRKMFVKRWEELHGKEVEGYSLDVRLKRANEGKKSANDKYTGEKNWFGAMYTYAIAWGCLLPYYPEALAGSDKNIVEIGIFEGAIWSNLAACIMTGAESNTVDKSQKPGMIQLGLRSALVCMAMNEYVTVSVMSKACTRAAKLRGMLKASEHQVKDTEVVQWTKQVELLEGVDGKMLYKDVPASKKVIHPKVSDLRKIQIV